MIVNNLITMINDSTSISTYGQLEPKLDRLTNLLLQPVCTVASKAKLVWELDAGSLLLGVLLLLNLYLEVDLDLGVAGDLSTDVDHFSQAQVFSVDVNQLHARILRPIDHTVVDHDDLLIDTSLVRL